MAKIPASCLGAEGKMTQNSRTRNARPGPNNDPSEGLNIGWVANEGAIAAQKHLRVPLGHVSNEGT